MGGERGDTRPSGEDCLLVALKATVVTIGIAVLMGLWHKEVAALAPSSTRGRAVAFHCPSEPEASTLLRGLAEAGYEPEALPYSDREADRLLEDLAGRGTRDRPAVYVRQAIDKGSCATARFQRLLHSLEAVGVAELGRREQVEEPWETVGFARNTTGLMEYLDEGTVGNDKVAGAVSGRLSSPSPRISK